MLIALYPVPLQLSQLADTVQRSYTSYASLVQKRQPLKFAFVLTLSFVVLMSLIAAVYGAFFAAQRLVQPVQDLIAGTRAVAKGNYDTRLPLPGRDELGFLVTSFNDMTKRLGRAREETRRSQQAVEARARRTRGDPRAPIDRRGVARAGSEGAHRQSGGERHPGRRSGGRHRQAFRRVDQRHARLFTQFLSAIKQRLQPEQLDWREQIELLSESGKHVLMCACTALPNDAGGAAGVVLVFDDITTLLQAQRDAAWGEVARRLAHEIKNPLTPIQLSAERMRRKFLRQHERAGRANPRARDQHHRGAGRCDEADGQRVQRICARARHAFLALRSEPVDHRGRGPVPRAGQQRGNEIAVESRSCRPSRPTACESGRS